MINAIKADIYFRIGQTKAEKGYFEESVSFFDKAITLSKNPSGVFLHKALSLSNLKKYEESVSVLKRAINITPSNPCNYLFLGIINYDNHRPDDAIDCFKRVLELSPDNSYAECYKYLCYLLKNEKDLEALENLSKKIQFSNAEFKARYLIHCETFLYHHRQDSMSFEVKEFYDTYLDPHKKKMMLAMDDTPSKFESFIRRILYIFKPPYKEMYEQYQLAIKYLFAEKIDKAQEQIQLILDVEPQFEDALDIFTDICLYKNEIDLSLKYLKKIDAYSEILKTLNQKNASKDDLRINTSAALNLAILFTHKGDYEKAINSGDTLLNY